MAHKLLYPEHIDAAYFKSKRARAWLENRAQQVANNPAGHSAKDVITVLIRTRNDEAGIESLLKDIKAQDFAGKVEVILVDTESPLSLRTILTESVP